MPLPAFILPAAAATFAFGSKLFSDKKTNNKLIIGGGIAFSIWYLNKKYKEQKEREQSGLLSKDSNTKYASVLHSAFFTFGDWRDTVINTTDEQAIFDVAPYITDWAGVQEAYLNLYQRNLLQDLQKELNASEYAKFLQLLGSKGADGKDPTANKEVNYQMAIKTWQQSYVPLKNLGKSIPVYNRYINTYRAWVRDSKGGFIGKQIKYTTFGTIGHTTGTILIFSGEPYIDIINFSTNVRNIVGSSTFYVKQAWVMQSAPPKK